MGGVEPLCLRGGSLRFRDTLSPVWADSGKTERGGEHMMNAGEEHDDSVVTMAGAERGDRKSGSGRGGRIHSLTSC